MAGQGVAVGAQPRRGQPDDGVAGPHPLGTELGPLLHHADGEAGQVELVARHDAGVLGRLAADQRAAGLAAALVHARHDGGHLVGVDLAGGDVVEHEERLGAHADQVVDAHGDQVDADRARSDRCRGRRPSWCPRRRSRPPGPGAGEAGHVERELATEPADARHQGAQALDGGVAGRDVHTGAGVGGAALSHDGQTPGARPGGP